MYGVTMMPFGFGKTNKHNRFGDFLPLRRQDYVCQYGQLTDMAENRLIQDQVALISDRNFIGLCGRDRDAVEVFSEGEEYVPPEMVWHQCAYGHHPRVLQVANSTTVSSIDLRV